MAGLLQAGRQAGRAWQSSVSQVRSFPTLFVIAEATTKQQRPAENHRGRGRRVDGELDSIPGSWGGLLFCCKP